MCTPPPPLTNPFLPGETFLHSLCEGAVGQHCSGLQTYYTLDISTEDVIITTDSHPVLTQFYTWELGLNYTKLWKETQSSLFYKTIYRLTTIHFH